MKLALIVATDEAGLIGKNNDLPWRLSADLQYFKRITMGKPIIMGRKTHESIGRPLPGRDNIIITSDREYQAEGCIVTHSITEALEACQGAEQAMIMGGSSLYEQCLPMVDMIYLTQVHATLEGDTWFPEWVKNAWQCISEGKHPADDKNEYPYSFMIYQRK